VTKKLFKILTDMHFFPTTTFFPKLKQQQQKQQKVFVIVSLSGFDIFQGTSTK
jgi:hypothetical protein